MMREKLLRRSALAALKIETDPDMPREEFDSLVYQIYLSSIRFYKREEVVAQVRRLIDQEREQRALKTRTKGRFVMIVLMMLLRLQNEEAHRILDQVELDLVMDEVEESAGMRM